MNDESIKFGNIGMYSGRIQKCEICGKPGSEGFGYILCDDHANMVAERITEYVDSLKPKWYAWRDTERYCVQERGGNYWNEYYAIKFAAAEALYQYMKQEKGE
jgi:hypothetical protein